MDLSVQLLLLPVLIIANAFFVAGEYVLVTVRRPQIHAMAARGYRLTATNLSRLKANTASSLGGIQVGITMVNLMLGWLGEPAMNRVLSVLLSPLHVVLAESVASAISITLAFILVTIATVILSELLPKTLTLQHTFTVARLVSGPLVLSLWLIRPLVWFMDIAADRLSRLLGLGPIHIEEPPAGLEELAAIARDAGARGALGRQEQTLIVNTLALVSLRASDVMIPRVRVAYLDLQRSMEQNIDVIEQHLYSRLPLCNGGMDRIVGIVYTKEFLTAALEPADTSVLQLICRPAVFAPSTITLDRLLALFLEKHSRMIVLVDEYGGVDGVATLTDVMDRLLIGERDEAR